VSQREGRHSTYPFKLIWQLDYFRVAGLPGADRAFLIFFETCDRETVT